MANYFIGDLQGCYDDLRRLLELAEFNPERDTLWLTGDLVARGPKSLETMRFVTRLPNVKCVLGNHDLHLLSVANGFAPRKKKDYLDELLDAPDAPELLAWLRQQPLMVEAPEMGLVMVHAGISPQWDIATARSAAREVEALLRDDHYGWLIKNMYGDHPDSWSESLQGLERYRYILNAFTRMRFCFLDGRLDFKCKLGPKESTPGLTPWFSLRGHLKDDPLIVFGHWAALMGDTQRDDLRALDTGCVWGNSLTIWRYEDDSLIATPCPIHSN